FLKPDPRLPRLRPLDKVSIPVYKRRPRRYNSACGGGAPAASSDAPLRSGHALRAVSSGGERFVDTEEVTGSNPVLPIFGPTEGCQWSARPRAVPLVGSFTPPAFSRTPASVPQPRHPTGHPARPPISSILAIIHLPGI